MAKENQLESKKAKNQNENNLIDFIKEHDKKTTEIQDDSQMRATGNRKHNVRFNNNLNRKEIDRRTVENQLR